ncbi:hypothetical protein Q9R32_03515 [Actinotalea sp. AC32]|nr:hypothetical protein [Actinotalea sp. AC32]
MPLRALAGSAVRSVARGLAGTLRAAADAVGGPSAKAPDDGAPGTDGGSGAGGSGAAKDGGTTPKAAPPDPSGNPFAPRTAQALSTLTWLVGALGAVASLMVAGTQLTSIGGLSWEEDRPRLLAAGGSVTLAVVLVVAAVGLLTWATMPGRLSDLERLDELAAGSPRGEVASSVARDSSYHRGTGSLPDLLTALTTARGALYEAKSRLHDADLAAAREADDDARAARSAHADRVRAEVAVLTARNDDLRLGARAAVQLDSHLRTRRRVVGVSWTVLVVAVVVAACLVLFAWAANPPEDPDAAEPAVPARPVAAVLVLASDDGVWDDRLGAACADAARDGGVDVVAVGSDDDAVTVVVVPGDDCPDPVEVVVPRDEGTVTAGELDPDGP